jgi:glycosyltransferase involved in cell wall biosynthesis
MDIVHTQLNYANIHGTFAAKLDGIKAVSSLHNASVHLYSYKPYRTWLETLALRCCSSRIIACGYTVASVQQPRFGRKHLDVVPNPVPQQPVVSATQVKAVRRELGIKKDEIVVISVGRLIPEKGYSDLIQAVAAINRAGRTPVRLLIVGRGYLMQNLMEEVRRVEQQERILLLGERGDVPKLLAASDIYASASHYEGQSLAVLEAMSRGLPVVATDVGDNRRVISDERGIVLPSKQIGQLSQAISRLAVSPQERRKFGRKASVYISQVYSPVVWVERLLDIYAEVLSD